MLAYPEINPVVMSFGPILGVGPFTVYWYGVMYLLAFLLAFWICVIRGKRENPPWTLQTLSDLFFYAALGVIFGGSLGFILFYSPETFSQDPLAMFKFWLPGRSFHGGLLGVVLALAIYARVHHRSFLELLDFAAPAVPLGLGVGRLGNFINAELWGRVTTLPWGMVFPGAGPLPRHPSQLYEFFLEGIVLFIIVFTFSMKKRPMGAVSGMFLLFYGIFRMIVECFRAPTSDLVWGSMTMGQLLSLPMMIVGLALLYFAYRGEPKK